MLLCLVPRITKWQGLKALPLCIVISSILLCGCGHFREASQAKPAFAEANDSFNQGSYQAALSRYREVVEKYPTAADRALFEMGIVYSHANNEQKDYRKSLECFQKVIQDFPESEYRRDSEMMVFYVNNVLLKDNFIASQQTKIESLQQQVAGKGAEIDTLRKQVAALEQKLAVCTLLTRTADRILVEKKERRLTLYAQGEVLKRYRIALGGDPDGPKERQGDNKTPEGIYHIESRNKDSGYHLSLRISYPNEGDRKRARELGVSPGGDVMIHGIKNGFSWVGDLHSGIDWTKGCIAVTDPEIEEIDRLVPNGTVVEIRP